uniref:Dynein axonemal heavy chain 2 n=1 Tax=Molossus molossus TaxID=27622 RepID=A0A7J8CX94_MOLMO|nr:dynein axonemal heavy chain 2 [Molossus molossus]
MSGKAEKKRKAGGWGGVRKRAAQAAVDAEAGKATLPASEPEPEPEPEPEAEPVRKEPEPTLEEPEVQKEELQMSEVDVKPLFLSRAVLTGLADAKWTEEHDAILEHFAQDPSEPVLTIFIDPCLGLKLDLGMPVQSYFRFPRSVEPHSVRHPTWQQDTEKNEASFCF